jgi:hypothetical protein
MFLSIFIGWSRQPGFPMLGQGGQIPMLAVTGFSRWQAFAISALAAVAIAAAPGARATSEPCLQIATPQQGEAVPWRPIVSGTSCTPGATVWVVVYPKEFPSCWAQPTTVFDGASGKWRTRIYIGEPTVSIGEKFDIVAVTNPNPPIVVEGRLVNCRSLDQIRGEHLSARVTVVRR